MCSSPSPHPACCAENMPTVAEGFEHVIIVTSDEEAAIVLRAWQEFQPDQHSDPSLVLSEIRSQLPRSAFISRGDTPFTLAGGSFIISWSCCSYNLFSRM